MFAKGNDGGADGMVEGRIAGAIERCRTHADEPDFREALACINAAADESGVLACWKKADEQPPTEEVVDTRPKAERYLESLAKSVKVT